MPVSAIFALRCGYIFMCVVHFCLLIAAKIAKRRGKELPFRLGGTLEPLGVAAVAGLCVSLGLILARPEVRPVSDAAMVESVQAAETKLDQLVEDGIKTPLAVARATLDTIAASLQLGNGATLRNPDMLRQLSDQYRTQTKGHPSDVIAFQGTHESTVRLVRPECDAPPPYVTDIMKRAKEQAVDRDEAWLQWTPIGYLVVTARQYNEGTLVAAELWGEGEFFNSTRDLWDDAPPTKPAHKEESHATAAPLRGFGLFLLAEDDLVTYSTEIAPEGRRLTRTHATHIPSNKLTEISTSGRVDYVYQSRSERFPKLFLRVQLPPGTLPTLFPWILSIVSSILLTFAVLLYFYSEHKHQERNQTLQ